MPKTVIEALAFHLTARINCIRSGNTIWKENHEAFAKALVKEFMPRGAGFDNGVSLILSESDNPDLDVIRFKTAYHNMTETGFYNGWTEYRVTVYPSFLGLDIRVSGKDQNGLKDHVAECFEAGLNQMIEFDQEAEIYTLAKADNLETRAEIEAACKAIAGDIDDLAITGAMDTIQAIYRDLRKKYEASRARVYILECFRIELANYETRTERPAIETFGRLYQGQTYMHKPSGKVWIFEYVDGDSRYVFRDPEAEKQTNPNDRKLKAFDHARDFYLY